MDYLGASREYGETPPMPIATYRRLLGLSDGQYARFKDLSLCVIRKTVEEINRVTDFRVTVEYKGECRRVTAVKFKIRRVLMLPEPGQQQGMLFPDLEDMPAAVKKLKDAGLSPAGAWDVWQQGFQGVEAEKSLGTVEGASRPCSCATSGRRSTC